MDSELLPIFTGITLGMTVFAFLLLRFTGNYALYIMLGVCFIIAFILAFFGGMLLSWGNEYNTSHFFLCLLLFFGIPCLVAYAFNYGLINTLERHGFLTLRNILLFSVLAFLIFRFVTRYEKYNWKTYLVKQKDNPVALLSVYLSGTERNEYSSVDFISKPYLFDINALNYREKSYAYDDIHYTGMPRALEVVYYSKKEEQLYRGAFTLPKKQIQNLIGNGLLFPITGQQQYDHINLVIKNEGIIALQLANLKEDVMVFQGSCTPITEKELSDHQSDLFEEYKEDHFTSKDSTTLQSEAPNTLSKKDWDFLFKQHITIKHEITGLTDQIIGMSAITANGTRYTIDQAFWDGKAIPKAHSPIVSLQLFVVKNEEKKGVFTYTYAPQKLITCLQNEDVKEIKYTHHIYETDENLLRVESFEYVNGKEYDFEVAATFTKRKR